MIIRAQSGLPYSAVTPKDTYLNRRRFLAGAAGLGALSWAGTKLNFTPNRSLSTSEKLTPYQDVTTYNNYYEFGTAKDQPAIYAKDFRTAPWTIRVDGETDKRQVLDMDAIMKIAPLEERIYRHRCVEAWSMVVPWIGFPLSALIKKLEPNSKAKFVAFETYFDSRQMPRAQYGGLPFPYVEGLRMDEAMHPLTLLAVGLYGETLPNQNGAPLRLVIPWKYGFKAIKSIARIRFTERMPPTSWNLANAGEYGFYSNVNPAVDHPRWTQSKERRIGEFFKRDTLPFNGYASEVAGLYAGMDLRRNY